MKLKTGSYDDQLYGMWFISCLLFYYYASVKNTRFIWHHITVESDGFHSYFVLPWMPDVSCFAFVIFTFLLCTQPQLSEPLFPCEPLSSVVVSLISRCSAFVRVVKSFWGWALVNCIQTSKATWSLPEPQYTQNHHNIKSKRNCSFFEVTFIRLPPSFRSSQRSSNRWTMKLWCSRGRPRSTATPTETCCCALWTMSRWVPSCFVSYCLSSSSPTENSQISISFLVKLPESNGEQRAVKYPRPKKDVPSWITFPLTGLINYTSVKHNPAS